MTTTPTPPPETETPFDRYVNKWLDDKYRLVGRWTVKGIFAFIFISILSIPAVKQAIIENAMKFFK